MQLLGVDDVHRSRLQRFALFYRLSGYGCCSPYNSHNPMRNNEFIHIQILPRQHSPEFIHIIDMAHTDNDDDDIYSGGGDDDSGDNGDGVHDDDVHK